MEEGCSEEEAYDDASSSHHAHDADHGSRQTQRIEVHEVGSTQEDADKDDGPVPAERGCLVACRPP